MKNINLENLEILSPAGSPDCFLSALNSGADAIYLGLGSFNARMKAENFSKENIREYIKLAHSHSVKVYITINTLLNDDDFDELISLVDFLTQAKADAFIVQDLGVAYVLKNCFKDIVLHASTQMGIHNLEGALVAEKLGFSRVVLSRETTIEDIKEIHQNTNLEIEYFIQGALCVAFSGNCYLSSLEHNASGNEGKCLQLCRLPYKNTQTNETKYYLSPRDLSLLELIPKLIDAGVTSFKIEGRMKHSGYVAICTNLYKNALNLIKNNNFNIKFINESYETLKKTFSRGDFNKNAYLFKNNENYIINSTFQNHIGIKIGYVEKVKPFKKNLYEIIINSNHEISSGDGLKFIDNKNNQIASIGVGNVEYINNKFRIITKHKLKPNLNVYLIQDSKTEKKYLENKKKIPLILEINAKKCDFLKISTTIKGEIIEYISDEILQPASNTPISAESIKNQFTKTTDTIFEITEINIDTDGIFTPKSILNKHRRKFLEDVQNKIIYNNEKYLNAKFLKDEYEKIQKQSIKTIYKKMAIVEHFDNKLDDFITQIIAPSNYINFLNNIKSISNNKNLALFLPVISNFEDKKIINKIIDNLPTPSELFVNNISGLYYKIFKNKNIIISPLLNIKNKYALMFLNSIGVFDICASIEATDKFINKYNPTIFSDGYFPLMTFAHCPYQAINDSSCKNCKFDSNLEYISTSNQSYKISRVQISKCYFYLMKKLNKKTDHLSLKNLKTN